MAPAEAPLDRRVVLEVRSAEQKIFVVDEGRLRMLRFGSETGDDQSGIDLDDDKRVVFEYVRLALAPVVLLPEPPARALVIGLGAGSWPRALVAAYPRVQVDAVEIDPVVVDVAQRFFGLVRQPRLHIHVADGAGFIAKTSRVAAAAYDVVLVDAFSGSGIPDALRTERFFSDLHARVRPEGIVVANVALLDEGETRQVIDRFAEAFFDCVILRGRDDDNRIVVGRRAGAGPALLTPAHVRARLQRGASPFSFPLESSLLAVESCAAERHE